MQILNYNRIKALNPTKYGEVTNQRGQLVEFYEHPTKGDEYPVIAIIEEFKEAVCTDFFDTSDFFEGSDYNPVYMHGFIDSAFYFDL
mgnify:FL=1|tara:strand:+ start:138 stop:398 length:261 start_codon:yes stop_codon:yes gene_type:complete